MHNSKQFDFCCFLLRAAVCVAVLLPYSNLSAEPSSQSAYADGGSSSSAGGLWYELSEYYATSQSGMFVPDATAGVYYGSSSSSSSDVLNGVSVPDGSEVDVDCYQQGIPLTYHLSPEYFQGFPEQAVSGEEGEYPWWSIEESDDDSGKSGFQSGPGNGKACVSTCTKNYSGQDLCDCLDFCKTVLGSNGCSALLSRCAALSGAARRMCMIAYNAAC